MRLLGLDPGLQRTGWGVIDAHANRLSHVAHGVIATSRDDELAQRLAQIHDGLARLIKDYKPDAAAVEETFVTRNGATTLLLGQARGVAMLVPALAGLAVAEYPAILVKKSIVGVGHAGKEQVIARVCVLLPGCGVTAADAADALAVAICHAHVHATGQRRLAGALVRRAAGAIVQ